MEQATLLQIARLRTLAARKGKPFDVARFATDRAFAQATLNALLDSEDEELLVAGLSMLDALGMTAGLTSSEHTPPPTSAPPPPAAVAPGKYVGRLR
ncbi:hypothetical protein [Roseateles sp. LKC17W]|uniref:XRE family transcriptional regulator n=1 Tax=Pelomonas margarita TaxID=3299031 RepID=A0ABW7FKC3_9BURK